MLIVTASGTVPGLAVDQALGIRSAVFAEVRLTGAALLMPICLEDTCPHEENESDAASFAQERAASASMSAADAALSNRRKNALGC